MRHLSIWTAQIYAEVTKMKIDEDITNPEKRIEGEFYKAYIIGRRNRRYSDREKLIDK